jgi:hypothetical protein
VFLKIEKLLRASVSFFQVRGQLMLKIFRLQFGVCLKAGQLKMDLP